MWHLKWGSEGNLEARYINFDLSSVCGVHVNVKQNALYTFWAHFGHPNCTQNGCSLQKVNSSKYKFLSICCAFVTNWKLGSPRHDFTRPTLAPLRLLRRCPHPTRCRPPLPPPSPSAPTPPRRMPRPKLACSAEWTSLLSFSPSLLFTNFNITKAI